MMQTMTISAHKIEEATYENIDRYRHKNEQGSRQYKGTRKRAARSQTPLIRIQFIMEAFMDLVLPA